MFCFQVLSPNALRQKRFRERRRLLNNEAWKSKNKEESKRYRDKMRAYRENKAACPNYEEFLRKDQERKRRATERTRICRMRRKMGVPSGKKDMKRNESSFATGIQTERVEIGAGGQEGNLSIIATGVDGEMIEVEAGGKGGNISSVSTEKEAQKGIESNVMSEFKMQKLEESFMSRVRYHMKTNARKGIFMSTEDTIKMLAEKDMKKGKSIPNIDKILEKCKDQSQETVMGKDMSFVTVKREEEDN